MTDTPVPDTPVPDTIVLVHGLWMTPRSWEGWVDYYDAKGYTVVTPGYPGFDIEVEALRENPEVIARLTVPETVDHLASVIEALGAPPIIMGHSFGGTLTQLLLARGLGASAVVIDSAPTEGVRVNPLSQVKSLFPALKNPANRHKTIGFTAEEFHYAFTNTLRGRSRTRSGSAITSLPPAAGCGSTACSPTSSPATRRRGWTTTTTTALPCCSSAAARTTSCRRR